jgi:hypothetical protein
MYVTQLTLNCFKFFYVQSLQVCREAANRIADAKLQLESMGFIAGETQAMLVAATLSALYPAFDFSFKHISR